MNITLEPINEKELSNFKKDMQEAFEKGLNIGNDEKIRKEILPEIDINNSLLKKGSIAYGAKKDGKIIGGAIVNINEETQHNHLEFIYVKFGIQNKGLGKEIWKQIEKLYPNTKIWRTETPYFDQRNIHFYINSCGFHAVEFFNKYHKDPHPSQNSGPECYFRFEKKMKEKD